MSWTIQDAIRFHNWELDIMECEACERMGIPITRPKNPEHYDLWKSGEPKPKP